MELLKGILTTVFVLHIIKANAQSTPGQNATIDEEQELRTMLKTVLDQNRKLVLQNKRLQQVWAGMQQMCKALSMSTCNCSEPETSTSSVKNTNSNDTVTTQSVHNKSALPLQVVSIKSSGVNSDLTTVSIMYSASPDHTTGWIGPRTNGGMWRTSGRKTQAFPGSALYTSTVDIEQIQSIRSLFFRLYDDEQSLSVKLNLTEIEKPQQQNVTAPVEGLLQVNSSYMAPLDSDLNITAIVNKDTRDFQAIDFLEIFLTGLNTSANPPEVFEILNFNSEVIDVSISRRTDTTTNMVITIRYPSIQYGGILAVLLPYREAMSGMVERLFYGNSIKIYAPDSKEVLPRNTIGVFPLAQQTVIFPPAQSIMCAAMGNPRPNVAILKVVNNGKTKELETETFISDSYTNSKVLTLAAKRPRKEEGVYICRATNGNQTVNVSTEVVVLKPAVFDENKTGVMKNTSKIIVISCKAKGKPKPKLGLRLYDEYGPDLIRSGMYQVSKSVETNVASRVTLSISPRDDHDIHTVYCVAAQGDANGSFEISHKINVYPGVDRENNWELYQRVQESQVF
ncbi:uncharacterized protein LOC128546085 [Mercenaria mercenaria]|uniref:uncharacterized protein LOC128546085 n=1 Tax=Mercenaria mercenaria TaxID=6596 RepID=UPI00234F5051|nr:uncharacterized protein LOC128546085 [Mercenaria mercenaria]